MHVFAGYNLKGLLDEPLEIFMELARLADQVLVNRALDYPAVTLSTPLHKNESILEDMRRRRRSIFRKCADDAPGEAGSGEQLRAALELARRINSGETATADIREYRAGEIINEDKKV